MGGRNFVHPMKRLLRAHRPVFVAGMLGVERYDWFRGVTDPLYQNLIPSRETDEGAGIPFFFFPSLQRVAWVEFESGEFVPWHPSMEALPDVAAKYYPIPRHLVPDGFLYILLPPFGKSFDLKLASKFLFQDGTWMKPGARLLWMDCFPYHQNDAVETLTSLRSEFDLLDTTVCLFRSGRRYAYSDISDEDAAIQSAKQQWMSRGVCSGVMEVDAQPDRKAFTSFLYAGHSYLSPIQSHVKRQIEEFHSQFRKFFHQDFDMQIMDMITADFLEPVFAYSSWRNSENHLIAGWNQQLHTKLLSWLNERIETFVETQLSGTADVYDQKKLLQNQLSKMWQSGFTYILREFPEECFLPDHLDEIQYMAQIKLDKVRYIEVFRHVIHVMVRGSLEDVIERHYALWNKLA